MPAINELLDRLLAGGPDAGDAFDRLADEGERAVAPIGVAIAGGRGWLVGAELLAALAVPDRARAIAPLLAHANDRVRSAAVIALGLSADPAAAPVLLEAFATGGQRRTAITALGNLGEASIAAPLLAALRTSIGDPTDPSAIAALLQRAEDDFDPADALVAADAARAFAKLGDHSLVGAAIALSGFRPDEALGFVEAGAVRRAAVQALDVSTGPGVAAACAAACADPDPDVAVEALSATLHIGRLREADAWVALGEGHAKRNEAVMACLHALTGETPPEIWLELQRWWAKIRKRLEPNTSYRGGKPASPATLIAALDGRDGATARSELQFATGRPFIHTLSIASPRERAAIDAWWEAHAPEFPPGKLHRWGRTFEPSAVD